MRHPTASSRRVAPSGTKTGTCGRRGNTTLADKRGLPCGRERLIPVDASPAPARKSYERCDLIRRQRDSVGGRLRFLGKYPVYRGVGANYAATYWMFANYMFMVNAGKISMLLRAPASRGMGAWLLWALFMYLMEPGGSCVFGNPEGEVALTIFYRKKGREMLV